MATYPKPTPMPTDEQKTGMIVKLCAGIEMASGIALIATPLIIFHLIFGVRLADDAAVLGRLLGLAELCLALACWFSHRGIKSSSVRAFVLYNLLVALYLAYLGAASRLVGYLLWPAFALHLILGGLPVLDIRSVTQPTGTLSKR